MEYNIQGSRFHDELVSRDCLFTVLLIHNRRATEALSRPSRKALREQRRAVVEKDSWISEADRFLVPLYFSYSPKYPHVVSERESPEA
jgi:hypothetical protein